MSPASEPGAAAPRAGDLPPGPPLHPAVQTLGFILGGRRFLDACRRRYGDVVLLRTLFDDGFVMLFSPEHVKTAFQGSNARLHAGEANRPLGPILGERSVLLLDGDEHLRHRRLMLPAFHGQSLAGLETAILEATDEEIDGWPVREPFALMPSMQALTMKVIVRSVFGLEPGPQATELGNRLRAMIEPLAKPRGLLIASLAGRGGREAALARAFASRRAAVDELLFAEIGRRRAEGTVALARREDVLSALLAARDDDGEQLSDQEVRDELVTLLLAGHETTATGLAWTFDLLLHAPAVLARARSLDDRYLDAVVKESLRIRPVIAAVGRVVRGAPYEIGGYTIPVGMEINPSIRIVHGRGDLYPDPSEFRPERFLGADAPDTYTWLPFGGGTRRCIGASFATTEMRLVVRRVLERAALRAADRDPEGVTFRAITLAPKHGTRVVLEDRAPRG